MYNKRCCKRLQTAACNEYTEKYSRGRRGAPAKGVGRLSRRESSNLSFSAKKAKASPHGDAFCFRGYVFFDASADEREVEFVNLPFFA